MGEHQKELHHGERQRQRHLARHQHQCQQQASRLSRWRSLHASVERFQMMVAWTPMDAQGVRPFVREVTSAVTLSSYQLHKGERCLYSRGLAYKHRSISSIILSETVPN